MLGEISAQAQLILGTERKGENLTRHRVKPERQHGDV